MMSKVIIRKATFLDEKIISDLIIRNALPELPPQAHAFMCKVNTPEEIKQRLSDSYIYFIAERQTSTVGVLGIREYENEPNHLYHLFVDKEFRKLGIARKLWDYHLANKSQNRLNNTYRVNSSLMAVGVYEKFGFIKNGKTFEKNHIPCVPMIRV